MKIIQTASGKKKLKLSKKEWERMGLQAGWIRLRASTVNYTDTVPTTVTLPDGNEYDVLVTVRVTNIGNNGIGSYEFWGTKGFDRGNDYVEDFEIESVKLNNPQRDIVFTEEEEQQAKSILNASDAFAELVQEKLSPEVIESYYDDEADYRYDEWKDRQMEEKLY
jgi:hypothetical protein